MKRIQRGPVRGISFKLQEEERERKDQFVPEVSALDYTQNESGLLDVDQETKDLLKTMGVRFLFLMLWFLDEANGAVRLDPRQHRRGHAAADCRASPLRRPPAQGLSLSKGRGGLRRLSPAGVVLEQMSRSCSHTRCR